jgi:hypothetical protein
MDRADVACQLCASQPSSSSPSSSPPAVGAVPTRCPRPRHLRRHRFLHPSNHGQLRGSRRQPSGPRKTRRVRPGRTRTRIATCPGLLVDLERWHRIPAGERNPARVHGVLGRMVNDLSTGVARRRSDLCRLRRRGDVPGSGLEGDAAGHDGSCEAAAAVGSDPVGAGRRRGGVPGVWGSIPAGHRAHRGRRHDFRSMGGIQGRGGYSRVARSTRLRRPLTRS